MAKERILVIDDEDDIVELVRYNLVREGFEVIGVQSGEDALLEVSKAAPALIVLDVMLPGVDGLEVCRQCKLDSALAHIPIVMLTARGEEADIVAGLELGADDYLVKPFSPRVLVARIKAVLRRAAERQLSDDEQVVVQGLVIDPKRHQVTINTAAVELTFTEFKMLHYLARHPGCVFTRTQIVDAVHGEDYPVTARSIDVQVVGLRKKLGELDSLIETVRGVGYRFKGKE